MKNITKTQDDDGHWYWIPNNILDQFKKELEQITGINYMDNPDAFDTFTYKYDQYRTMGSPDLMPEIFKAHPMSPKQEESDETTKFCSKIREDSMNKSESQNVSNGQNTNNEFKPRATRMETKIATVEKYYHPDVGTGEFVRRFNRPIYGEAIVIKLTNGREWFAPSWEFTKIEN